jgi:hypothetical protein
LLVVSRTETTTSCVPRLWVMVSVVVPPLTVAYLPTVPRLAAGGGGGGGAGAAVGHGDRGALPGAGGDGAQGGDGGLAGVGGGDVDVVGEDAMRSVVPTDVDAVAGLGQTRPGGDLPGAGELGEASPVVPRVMGRRWSG